MKRSDILILFVVIFLAVLAALAVAAYAAKQMLSGELQSSSIGSLLNLLTGSKSS